MVYQDITYEPGPVARVILNRPHKLNAQSWNLLGEMDDAFNEAVKDPDVRIILLSGAGPAFSAGHDLDSKEQTNQRHERTEGLDGYAKSAQLFDIYTESHLRWRDLPKPTVAMVHGYCIFGGWMIAAARAPRQEREPGQTTTDGRFRSATDQAMQYLKEDSGQKRQG